MMRLLALGGGLATVLFTICIGLIQAKPFDPIHLQATLVGDANCTQPCWHLIRPGHTTAAEALALLQADTWVRHIVREDQRIEWAWSGQQPSLVNASQPGWLTLDNEVVSGINIPTTISMGDLYFLLGTPFWKSTHRSQGVAEVRLSYPHVYLSLRVITRCPTTRSIFWFTRPDITLLSHRPPGVNFDTQLLNRSIDC